MYINKSVQNKLEFVNEESIVLTITILCYIDPNFYIKEYFIMLR